LTGIYEPALSLPHTVLNESPSKIDSPARAAYFRRLRAIGILAGMAVFVCAIYLSGRLGVEMARNRLPVKIKPGSTYENSPPLTAGRSGDPIYLAQSPESLRNFFARYPSSGERAGANLSGLGIRRLQDSVEMTALRAEADAVEVKVISGAIAGAVYWIHYSQFPNRTESDPIISPLPAEGSR